MKNWYFNCGTFVSAQAMRLEAGLSRFAKEEKGDLVSSLGWMAIIALMLVVIKGLMDGRMVGYVNNIFSHLDKVFNTGT